MSQELTMMFENVRLTIVRDGNGDIWFVGKEVCDLLGFANASDAMANHCRFDGVAKRYPIADSLGRIQEYRLIPEGDMYRLTCASTKPNAKRFEHWVFDVALPNIRKTGAPQPQSIEALTIYCLEEQRRLLAEKDALLLAAKPKVDFYDSYADAEGNHGLQLAGKILQQKPNKWIESLQRDGYLCRRGRYLVPCAQYVDAGLFKVVDNVVNGHTRPQTYVTPKGIQYFAKRLQSPPLMLEAPEVCQ